MLVDTLAWWLAIQAISLIGLPLTLTVFDRLPGRGYAFAKPLALILGGYSFWIALSLHLLPNRPGSVIWALLPLAAVSLVILHRNWRRLLGVLQERARFVLAVEVVFFAALFTAAFLRSFIPEIASTEKPMDFMLLNAADRSRFYPPDDPWLAGFDVSYYYFGYLIQAMLGKLAAISPAVVFNLGLAGTAALAATTAFGLAYELVRGAGRVTFRTAAATGIAALVLITIIGNLEGVLEFAAANGYLTQSMLDAANIANLDGARESSACLIGLAGQCFEYPTEDSSFWWWWRATRISPDANSITEFPFFSFLLGDLHPHVMALPFVMVALGLALNFWRFPAGLSLGLWRARPGLLLVSAVAIGGLSFINAWDLPTYGFLVAVMAFVTNLARDPAMGGAARDTAGFLWPLAALAGLLYVPFYLGFGSQAGAIDVELGEATQPFHSALFWLPLVLVSLPLPALIIARAAVPPRPDVLRALLIPGLVLVAWAAYAALRHGLDAPVDGINARGWNWITYGFFAACLSLTLLALQLALREPQRAGAALENEGSAPLAALLPALVLMAVAFLLILGSEVFFIDDVFNSRLNTVFKLSYQAWVLLGASGAVSLWLFVRLWPRDSRGVGPLLWGAWGTAATAVLFAALLYPVGATLSRTEGLTRPERTLDGLAYLESQGSGDLAAVRWLASRAGADERIVEAVGGPYSAAGRISAWSGVPAVLGWPGHEHQWGRDWSLLAQRQEDVDLLYSTESLAEAMAILQKYRVTYVVVGSVERQTYPESGLRKFEDALPVATQGGETTVYRVPRQPPDAQSSRAGR